MLVDGDKLSLYEAQLCLERLRDIREGLKKALTPLNEKKKKLQAQLDKTSSPQERATIEGRIKACVAQMHNVGLDKYRDSEKKYQYLSKM